MTSPTAPIDLRALDALCTEIMDLISVAHLAVVLPRRQTQKALEHRSVLLLRKATLLRQAVRVSLLAQPHTSVGAGTSATTPTNGGTR